MSNNFLKLRFEIGFLRGVRRCLNFELWSYSSVVCIVTVYAMMYTFYDYFSIGTFFFNSLESFTKIRFYTVF